MRILVVSNLYPPAVRGGYERECAGVVDHLRRAHDVHVLTSTEGSGGDGVVRALPLLTPDARGAVRAPGAAVRAARAARRETERFRPELVYVWNGAEIPHVALRVLDGLGVPLAFRVCEHWFGRVYGAGDQFLRHVRPGDRGARLVWALGVRALNRAHPALRADLRRVAPASVSWASDFLRSRTPVAPQLQVVHEEVLHPATPELDRFRGIERRPDPADPLVLFAGRLEERKGPQVLVRAAGLLARERGVRVRLVLAGPGDRSWLERRAASEGVTADFPGPLDVAALRELAARAHVWAMPSLWEEPAGMVVLEAALAGVPVVAARRGGIPEMLTEGEHVLLYAHDDAADAARALFEVLDDPAAAGRRAERALAAAEGKRHGPYLQATDRFLARAVAAHPGRG